MLSIRFSPHNLFLALMTASVLVLALPISLSAQEEWKVPADYDAYANPNQPTADSMTKGKAVYLKNCAICHGEKGDGKGPSSAIMPIKPADFTAKTVQAQSDGSLAFKILSGRGSMPAWAPILQEDEVWNVINYVRQMGK